MIHKTVTTRITRFTVNPVSPTITTSSEEIRITKIRMNKIVNDSFLTTYTDKEEGQTVKKEMEKEKVPT